MGLPNTKLTKTPKQTLTKGESVDLEMPNWQWIVNILITVDWVKKGDLDLAASQHPFIDVESTISCWNNSKWVDDWSSVPYWTILSPDDTSWSASEENDGDKFEKIQAWRDKNPNEDIDEFLVIRTGEVEDKNWKIWLSAYWRASFASCGAITFKVWDLDNPEGNPELDIKIDELAGPKDNWFIGAELSILESGCKLTSISKFIPEGTDATEFLEALGK